MPSQNASTHVWKWLATGLLGVVLSGGSYALGAVRMDERLSVIEIRLTQMEERQAALAERQARDTSDSRDRLIHIDEQLDKLSQIIISSYTAGRLK